MHDNCLQKQHNWYSWLVETAVGNDQIVAWLYSMCMSQLICMPHAQGVKNWYNYAIAIPRWQFWKGLHMRKGTPLTDRCMPTKLCQMCKACITQKRCHRTLCSFMMLFWLTRLTATAAVPHVRNMLAHLAELPFSLIQGGYICPLAAACMHIWGNCTMLMHFISPRCNQHPRTRWWKRGVQLGDGQRRV